MASGALAILSGGCAVFLRPMLWAPKESVVPSVMWLSSFSCLPYIAGLRAETRGHWWFWS